MTPVCTFFNNRGGIGKTTLVYHLAWMLAEQGTNVVVADLDPQANLTAAFFDDDQLVSLWAPGSSASVVSALDPLRRGVAGLGHVQVEEVADRLGVVVGDLALSRFEDELAQEWPNCLAGRERAFRITAALSQVLEWAADDRRADLVLVDVGPNLGALNRSVMVASDCVVVPVGADLFSLQGLRNLGPTLRDWRRQWQERVDKAPPDLDRIPRGLMQPMGYVVAQHGVRLDRPAQAYRRWTERIPGEFHRSVLGEDSYGGTDPAKDDMCLTLLKHYHSLIPLAQEARRPIFMLRAADGALGAHLTAVQRAHDDFDSLARVLLDRVTRNVSGNPAR